MTATTYDEVRPAGARHEGLALALAAAVVVGILAFYVHEHGRKETREPLYDWQVSAFNALTGADQAIYNALYTARDDIPAIYDDINMSNGPDVKFHWPSIKELEETELPPFFRDKSWRQNGALQWSLFEPLAEGEMQGTTMYLGTDADQPGQGSFLLVIGHVHAGFRNTNAIFIWWNAKHHVEMPRSGFRDGLILQGWREVVPYNGAQEVRRIFGGNGAQTTEDKKNADDIANTLFGKQP